MNKMQQVTLSLAIVLALCATSALVALKAQADEPQPAAETTTVALDPAALVPEIPAQPMAWGYTCEALGTTDTSWGMGSDCTAAAADLQFNLKVLGANECADRELFPCGITNTVIVTACHFYQGSYRTDGYATFKCRIYN